jgi:hypothetical protein
MKSAIIFAFGLTLLFTLVASSSKENFREEKQVEQNLKAMDEEINSKLCKLIVKRLIYLAF